MIVTPSEVLPLLGGFHAVELTIVPVLFSEVDAVRTIFLAVPRMIVVAVSVVLPSIVMIVSSHRHWGGQSSGGEKRGQNQKTTHIDNLLLVAGARQ